MFQKHWQPDMILNHILQREGREPLNSHYYATNYPDVYAAAERIFGSWCNTIEACGFDYLTIRKYRIWSKEKVLEEIRKLQQIVEPLSSKYAQVNHKSLYMAALKRFDSWGKAVQAAGVDYSQVRLRRHMTEEEIKAEILELYHKGESLAYTNMRKNHQYLLANGMKKLGFGSWDNARRACGIATNYRKIGQAVARERRQNSKQKNKASE